MIFKKHFAICLCFQALFEKYFLYPLVSVQKKKPPTSNWFSLLFLFTSSSSSCFVLSLCVFSLCLLSSLSLRLLKKIFRGKNLEKWFLQFSHFFYPVVTCWTKVVFTNKLGRNILLFSFAKFSKKDLLFFFFFFHSLPFNPRIFANK